MSFQFFENAKMCFRVLGVYFKLYIDVLSVSANFNVLSVYMNIFKHIF